MVIGGTLHRQRSGRLALLRSVTAGDEHASSATIRRDGIDLVRVVWPMREWAERIERAETMDGLSTLNELVLSNRVGERMRAMFKKQLIDPCCLLEMNNGRRYD
jgi:hypothetical protein